ncbi:MAG: hypothetical protein ACRD1Y_05070, partial [Terriglobales bacterium]
MTVPSAREQALAAHDRTWQQKQIAALRAEFERRFAAFVATGDRQWRQELDELKTALTAAQQRKLAAARTRQRNTAAAAWETETAAALGAEAPAPRAAPAVRPGDHVRLRSSRTPARV